jgi:hypothetical protein
MIEVEARRNRLESCRVKSATVRSHASMHIRSERNRRLDRGGNRLDSKSMTCEALYLGLKSGISCLEVGDTHGKIGDLGEKNGGIVDSTHILEVVENGW